MRVFDDKFMMSEGGMATDYGLSIRQDFWILLCASCFEFGLFIAYRLLKKTQVVSN